MLFQKSKIMAVNGILTSIAILFIAAVIWDDLRKNDRVTNTRKTWLLVACIFAIVSVIVQLLSGTNN